MKKTIIWQEIPRHKEYRIQTNDPAIARKLRRRKGCKLVLIGMNKNIWVYLTTYKYPWMAKRGLQRLTGLEIEKVPGEDEFAYQTTSILTSKKELVVSKRSRAA